jgi:hypothetical protein
MDPCPYCRQAKAEDGRCGCAIMPPRGPGRLASEPLDLESVDEDGPDDDAWWLGEEELPC